MENVMETFIDLWPYIVVAIVAYKIGGFVKGFEMIQSLARNPQRSVEMLEELKRIHEAESMEELNGILGDAIELNIEKVGEVVYAYNKETGQFLAQAQTAHQVAMLVAERFPGQKFWHPELKQDHQTS